jgi:hypothetical protein
VCVCFCVFVCVFGFVVVGGRGGLGFLGCACDSMRLSL